MHREATQLSTFALLRLVNQSDTAASVSGARHLRRFNSQNTSGRATREPSQCGRCSGPARAAFSGATRTRRPGPQCRRLRSVPGTGRGRRSATTLPSKGPWERKGRRGPGDSGRSPSVSAAHPAVQGSASLNDHYQFTAQPAALPAFATARSQLFSPAVTSTASGWVHEPPSPSVTVKSKPARPVKPGSGSKITV